ncbi:MAG TPA: hypothetical protein QF703_00650 [Candidatus Thalassarchaeaceae archaeon]|nr:hypothetical protein [Candidatus Thalassarchaeaceae archaeon]|tara:strand:- start:3021 stop:3227 length:207 start_codon:yes stop_codon:yes gene_type:complete
MGVGRAIVFAFLAGIPGVFLSLMGWVISGSPEEWSSGLFLACYAPFFGCVVAGFLIGMRDFEGEHGGA